MLALPIILASGPLQIIGMPSFRNGGPSLCLDGWIAWSTVDEYGGTRLSRFRAFMPVPGPFHTVQRAEFLGAILALQAFWPGHLGIDNLNVVRTSGRLLDRGCHFKPLSLVVIQVRGSDTFRYTKVKGHASEADVEQGRVREEDRLGNAEADAAADLG